VRATFRLPGQVIELLSVAASQLGVKQKSLFDQLVEDRSVLRRIASGRGGAEPAGKQRHQKTLVLSRNSLEALNETARRHRVARDILVEASIRRLVPVMSAERKKQEARKSLLESLTAYRDRGWELMLETESMLGKDDPLTGEIARMVKCCAQAVEQAGELVEKGKCLERIALSDTEQEARS
jgi:hypothetical protein